MKKVYITLFALLPYVAQAQNHVANGNFDQFTFCPNNFDQISNCTGWSANGGGVGEYFNVCNTTGGNIAGVPNNIYGTQRALSGNGYAGICTYINSQNYKDYLTRLITPLTIGVRYAVSMSVSLADQSGYTTRDIGVWFHRNVAYPLIGAASLPVTPQVSYSSYGNIRDTANWVRVTKTFIADSAYNHIVIGGFGAPSTTGHVATGFGGPSLYNAAYYYVDSVVVVPDIDVFVNPITDSIYCVGDSIHIDYTVGSDRFTSLNDFTLQMSDASGSFASPVVLGVYHFDTSGTIHGRIPLSTPVGTGYRLRVLSSDHADMSLESTPIIITNDAVSKPVGNSNSPVCTGNTVYFNASSPTPGVKYAWSGPRFFKDTTTHPTVSLATILDSGPYVVTAYIAGCTSSDTVMLNVIQVIGKVDIQSDSIACENDTLALKGHVIGKPVSYKWVGPNGFTAYSEDSLILHPSVNLSGQYIFTGYFAGCDYSDTTDITVKRSPQNTVATGDTLLCAGSVLHLSGSAEGLGLTQQWTGPNGYTTVQNNVEVPDIQVSQEGDYVFTTNIDGCKGYDTVSVVVRPLPATPKASSNSPLLTGDALVLTAGNTVNGVSYSWRGPGNYSSKELNPILNDFAKGNIGIYVLTAELKGCTASDSVAVILNTNTDPIIIYPNPSSGNFAIHAVFDKDQEVVVKITNSTGQMVYEEKLQTVRHVLKSDISLKNTVSYGVYTLRIYADDKITSTRLVIK